MFSTDGWARGGARHRAIVRDLIERFDVTSVLDYGCGRGLLGNAVMGRDQLNPPAPVEWYDYDPSIPGKDVVPVTHVDLIVCTHVLEHVEPELLDATLDEFAALEPTVIYVAVPHKPSGAPPLPDGRNCHLTVEPPEWWHEKLAELGDVLMLDPTYMLSGKLRDESRFVITP